MTFRSARGDTVLYFPFLWKFKFFTFLQGFVGQRIRSRANTGLPSRPVQWAEPGYDGSVYSGSQVNLFLCTSLVDLINSGSVRSLPFSLTPKTAPRPSKKITNFLRFCLIPFRILMDCLEMHSHLISCFNYFCILWISRRKFYGKQKIVFRRRELL